MITQLRWAWVDLREYAEIFGLRRTLALLARCFKKQDREA